jgi:hypothetical protein
VQKHTSAFLPVLETCTNYASCAATVNPLLAQDIHLFSTTGERLTFKHCHSETASAVRNLLLALLAHATGRIFHSAPMPFRHKPRRKTISLKKDHLEVLAHVRLESLTYRTLRGTLSPNEAPWPGLICRNYLY